MSSTSDLPSTFYSTKPIDFTKEVDTSNVKDKSIIVTGGANGLGAGCATAFAEAGAYVTILDINEEHGIALTKKLTEKEYHVQFIKTDATSFDSQLTGFKSALSFSPNHTLDIVFVCAGMGGVGIQPWLEQSLENPDADPLPPNTAILDVNLTGAFYSTHLALHYFKKTARSDDTSSKQLILVCSLAGYLPLDKAVDYNASKFGVRGIWKAIRHSATLFGEDGPAFRTNLVVPTFIRTNMTAHMEPVLLSIGIALGEVEDVSAGVMRLACDETISGRAIVIAAREKVAGDRNFDLKDDWEGLDGGSEILGKIRDGTLNGLELVGGGNKFDIEQVEGKRSDSVVS